MSHNSLISKLDTVLAPDVTSTPICWETKGVIGKIVQYQELCCFYQFIFVIRLRPFKELQLHCDIIHISYTSLCTQYKVCSSLVFSVPSPLENNKVLLTLEKVFSDHKEKHQSMWQKLTREPLPSEGPGTKKSRLRRTSVGRVV